MRRRITKVTKVSFLSLCPRGANWQPVLYKEVGADNVRFELLTKASEDQGLLTSTVYIPERRDAEGDVASAEVVRDMAYSFAKEGMKLDLRHNETAIKPDQAHIVESFIIQKGDPRFADWKDYDGKSVDPTGGWGVVIKVDDLDLRKNYREGRWNGVSMGGRAEFQIEKEAEGDIMLTKEELQKMLAENNTSILKSMDEKLAAIKPPAPPAPPQGGVKNPLSIDEVRKHLDELERAKLSKEVAWDDPEQVAAHLARLEKQREDAKKNESPTERANRLEKELAVANAKLKKQASASAAPPTAGDNTDAGGITSPMFGELSKEQADAVERARVVAARSNKNRGLVKS